MTIDPETMRATAIERLTTGAGPDTDIAISPDGKRLAFTAKSEHIRTWLFPFDASTGRTSGNGRPITSPGIEAYNANLSRDGSRVAFMAQRAGRQELWEKSLMDDAEAPVMTDDYYRGIAAWSPDGTHLAYWRAKPATGESQFMSWSLESRTEEPLTSESHISGGVWDWSRDGQELLISQVGIDIPRPEVWLLPITLNGDATPRRILVDPTSGVYQSHFSPDGRWIVFGTAKSSATTVENKMFVVPATGGKWIPLTDGKYWDDKPRWSPDGKTIYFVSGRRGFFNVWGIHFDSAQGRTVGEPFQVTTFESPSLMIPQQIQLVGFSLSQKNFVLTMKDLSGSIWVLDNVDK